MGRPIPTPIIAVVSELVSTYETHASLDRLFMYAEASGDPPEGTKPAKALAWLRDTNKVHPEPLAVLGKIISGYMEAPEMAADFVPDTLLDEDQATIKKRAYVRRIEGLLARNGLQYRVGGHITDGGLAASKTLKELIHGRDLPAIHREFDRALETVESKPREAVSAAANSACRAQTSRSDMPKKNGRNKPSMFSATRSRTSPPLWSSWTQPRRLNESCGLTSSKRS